MDVYCCVGLEVDCCLCFLMSGNSGAHLVVYTVTLSKEGDKERLIVLFSRSKMLAAAVMSHTIVCDVGQDGPTGMCISADSSSALT